MKQVKIKYQDCYVGDYTNDPSIDVKHPTYDGTFIVRLPDLNIFSDLNISGNIDIASILTGTMVFKLIKFTDTDTDTDTFYLFKCIRRDFPWENKGTTGNV